MSRNGLRVAFAGTPVFAAEALRAILAAGFEVPLVMTQPDRPAGRGMKLTPSPVKRVALDARIAVDQPEKLRTPEQRATLAACAPDVLVVAAYGLILPREALAIPRLGCINIHASLLPRWRGAAPIHRAIEAGDTQTGIIIMQMDEGLDTGPMLCARAVPIDPDDSTATLHDRLAALGGEMIVEALHDLEAGALTPTPQPEAGVTYAAKIGKAEAVIDWRGSAEQVARRIRAFDPFPGARSVLRDTSITLWRAVPVPERGNPGEVLATGSDGVVIACGEGAVRVTELQRPGSRRMGAEEFLRGFPVKAGECFSTA
ncbi:MAG TPA: methionyl-tRNA formyltransferase [Azoarcus sp.]|nr:methionyl-tRNA formyltransferase [Azoarcus sp.]